MNDVLVIGTGGPLSLPAAIDISDGPFHERARVNSAGDYGEIPGGGSSNNGRCPWPLPEVRGLEIAWKRDFGTGFGIAALAGAQDRIYVAGMLRWSLIDVANGITRAGGGRGLGAGSLGSEHGLLYQPDSDGQLKGMLIDRGQPLFWSSLYLGDRFVRRFAAHLGDTLLLAGSERPMPEPEALPPSTSVLEGLAVGANTQVRESGQLSESELEPLLFEQAGMLPAAWSKGIAVAFPGRVFLLNERLKITAVLRGEFEPVALSVDESGWLHLIVREPAPAAPARPAHAPHEPELDEQGEPVPSEHAGPPDVEADDEATQVSHERHELWIVSPAGVRTVRIALPPPFHDATHPPLIAANRDVFVVGRSALLCLSPDGVIRWVRRTDAAIYPMVTPDGQVLAAEGNELIVFDQDGQRSLLLRFDPADLGGTPLTCAPLLDEGGVLTVASESHVLRLRPRPARR